MKNKIHIIIYLLLPISILIADVNEGLLLISDHESDISVLIDINQDENINIQDVIILVIYIFN